MGDWGILMATMVFASLLVFFTVIIAERFAGVWAPIWIVCFLIGMSILFDYGGIKQTELFLLNRPVFFAAGPMMWPVLALGQDYLNEFYGKKLAYNYTIGMFFAKVGVALGTLWIILYLPAPTSVPELAETARTFETLMLGSPRINIASIIAVIFAFAWNAWVFALLREKTKGKHLWLRNLVSSTTALTIDGFVFFYAAFAFVLPWDVLFNITISYILICYATVFIDMGFLYLMVWAKQRKWLGISDRIGEALKIETLKAFESYKE